MNETRTRIADRIRAVPGVHFSGLVRDLDVAPGQVQYHVRRLLADDRFVDRHLYGRTHYYPPGYDEWEQATLALLHRETAADVVAVLLERGPTPPTDVVAHLGIARGTLEWHLARLVEQGVVTKRRESGNRVTLALARPGETARLLRRASPSVPARLVDRFTRVVDQFFE